MPKLSLNIQILIGFLSGILFGLFFGDLCAGLEPLGMAFIKAWQITVIPSVVISLIAGIGGLKQDDARDIAVKVGSIVLLFWAIGIAAFFSMQLAFPHLGHASFFSSTSLQHEEGLDIMDVFIPYNPFHSLSEGMLPAIVVFCLCLGFALIGNGEVRPIVNMLNVLSSALSRINRFLMRTFPFGIFIITAEAAGTFTPENFLILQVFLVSLILVSILLGFIVLPLLVSCITKFSAREVISASSRAVMLGFSTGSDFMTLPFILEGVKGLFSKDDCEEMAISYSEILVPVAYTFPLMGAFVPFLFILFVAWFYGNPLTFGDQIKLTLVGIPSVFGSSKMAVDFLLSSMRLPADAFNLYISLGILRASFIAALTAISIFSFTTIGVAMLTGTCKFKPKRAILSAVFITLAFAAVIFGMKVGFAQMLDNTYHGSDIISNMKLQSDSHEKRLDEQIDSKVYLSQEDVLSNISGNYSTSGIANIQSGDIIERIKKRGSLRVGYNTNCLPFVFFNRNGSLVGFDVEMAYDLARFIGVSKIEFVPINGDTIEDSLNRGLCDIVMSSVTVTPERLEEMKFTDPYMTAHMAFVVKDERKKEFMLLSDVQEMDHLRLAVVNRTAMVSTAVTIFPNASIVRVDSLQEFFTQDRADALLTTAEEGSAMTLLYPFYDVAIFEPLNDFQIMYAYPVDKESTESFLMLLNYWLKMEKEYGQLEGKYDYWVLGKNAEEIKPRWSVIRDVLHWDV